MAIPKRRTVKVLDLKDSSKANKDVYIHFKKRLHPWTTIKVSNRLGSPAQGLILRQFIEEWIQKM